MLKIYYNKIEFLYFFLILIVQYDNSLNHLFQIDSLNLILKSYNKQKDFLNAKKVGQEHLSKCEDKPLILLEIAKAHLGLDENDKANEYLTKLLGIWEEADEEYIYYQEAKKLWKELNIEKAAIA